jgi:hypothetical protein
MTRYLAGRDTCDVFLDGGECFDVVECDDELGFVIRFKRDADGKLMLSEAHDTILQEVVLGHVMVVRTVNPTITEARRRR